MTPSRIKELRTLAAAGVQGAKSNALRECLDEIERLMLPYAKRKSMNAPSLAEVMTYAETIGMNGGEPEKFFDYHTARGWKMGKTASAPMRDWRAALRLWKRNCAPVGGKPKVNHFAL